MLNMVASWRQSGLSQKAYCEQHGVHYHAFHYWFKRYRQQNEPDTAKGFIPVQIQGSSTALQAGIEVIFTDGRRVLFHTPVDAAFIKAIIG